MAISFSLKYKRGAVIEEIYSRHGRIRHAIRAASREENFTELINRYSHVDYLALIAWQA